MSTLIDICALRHAYGEQVVLDLPVWQVPSGCHTLILGPSGCGKSTLLAVLAGLLTPTTGEVRVAGQSLTGLSHRARDAWRSRHVGCVMQRLHLIPALTVRENLRLAQSLAGLAVDNTRIDAALAALQVAGLAARKPHQLSVGEAQRVAIARAALNRPALLLADEPTSALDDDACAAALSLLQSAAAEAGATLVVATHDSRVKSRFTHQLALTRHERVAA